jgi:hypothetical protein
MNTSKNSIDEMWYNYLLKCYNNCNYCLIICQFREETCVKWRRQELMLWRETRLRRHRVDRSKTKCSFQEKTFREEISWSKSGVDTSNEIFFRTSREIVLSSKKNEKLKKTAIKEDQRRLTDFWSPLLQQRGTQ